MDIHIHGKPGGVQDVLPWTEICVQSYLYIKIQKT